MAMGVESDEEDEDLGDEDEDEESESEGSSDGGDDVDAMKAALKKANKQAEKARLALKEERGKKKKSGSDDEVDVEAVVADAVEKATEETEEHWKGVVVRAEAKSALVSAGVSAKRVNKLLRFIDTDEIDVDEAGAVTGMDSQVKALRKEFPELFKASDSGGVDADTGARTPTGKKPESSADRIAATLLAATEPG